MIGSIRTTNHTSSRCTSKRRARGRGVCVGVVVIAAVVVRFPNFDGPIIGTYNHTHTHTQNDKVSKTQRTLVQNNPYLSLVCHHVIIADN